MKKYIREKDVAVAEDDGMMEEDVMKRYVGEKDDAVAEDTDCTYGKLKEIMSTYKSIPAMLWAAYQLGKDSSKEK